MYPAVLESEASPKGFDMLVLTRATDEKIRIGKDISIMVVAIQDGRVKLGIKAPKDLPIVREELLTTARGRVWR